MKRKILITACYMLEAEIDEFWDKDSGYLTNLNDEYLSEHLLNNHEIFTMVVR